MEHGTLVRSENMLLPLDSFLMHILLQNFISSLPVENVYLIHYIASIIVSPEISSTNTYLNILLITRCSVFRKKCYVISNLVKETILRIMSSYCKRAFRCYLSHAVYCIESCLPEDVFSRNIEEALIGDKKEKA